MATQEGFALDNKSFYFICLALLALLWAWSAESRLGRLQEECVKRGFAEWNASKEFMWKETLSQTGEDE